MARESEKQQDSQPEEVMDAEMVESAKMQLLGAGGNNQSS